MAVSCSTRHLVVGLQWELSFPGPCYWPVVKYRVSSSRQARLVKDRPLAISCRAVCREFVIHRVSVASTGMRGIFWGTAADPVLQPLLGADIHELLRGNDMAGCVQTPAVLDGKLKHAPQTVPRLAYLPLGTQFEFDKLSSRNSNGRELSAACLSQLLV